MPQKSFIVKILLSLAMLYAPACCFAGEPGSKQITHDSRQAPTSTDSANALLEDIVKKYASDSTAKGQYACADAYIRLCDIYYRCGYYTNAFSAVANALKIAESNGFDNLLPSIYNYLGTIYCTWRDFSLGAEYFKKGLDYATPENNLSIYRSLLINIQGAYINMQNASLAKPFYDKMCGMQQPDSIIDYFKILNKGLFLLDGKDTQGAAACFKEAESMARSHRMTPSMLASTYDYLGDCFAGTDNDSATFFWDKAVTTPGNPPYLRLTILKKLCNTFKLMRQRDKAVYYGNKYMALSDSIFEVADINRMKDIQMAYENEKKIRRISELDADNKNRVTQLSSQRRFLIAALCVTAIFLLMSIILYRQKHKLQQAYIDLFSRNKEAMQIQAKSRLRENELTGRIASLEAQLEKALARNNAIAAESGTATSKEPKAQSVDRLSDEKRGDILSAIENVMGRDEIICNPDFSIDMLAELTGYNSRYVSHIVNDAYSCNFRTLLNHRRMDIARERIMDVGKYGNLTIQAIAESVGYKSNSGFVQLFRKHTGVTPSMFQKMAKDQTSLNPDGSTEENVS